MTQVEKFKAQCREIEGKIVRIEEEILTSNDMGAKLRLYSVRNNLYHKLHILDFKIERARQKRNIMGDPERTVPIPKTM